MSAEALGMTIAQGASNILFGQFNQDMALKGQQKALKQQNDAAMDIWNKTNYAAQRQQMEKAGLNPALLYGMGSGGGGSIGQSSSNMQGDINAPNVGMALQVGMQMELLQAQKENIQADTKNKLADAARTAGSQTDLDKAMTTNYSSLTKNNEAKTALTNIETQIAEIEKDILDVTQYYEMGASLEKWRKLQGEAKSALAAGEVDQRTIENAVQQRNWDLAIKMVIRESIKSGKNLTDQQIQTEIAKLQVLGAEAFGKLNDSATNFGFMLNEQNKESWNRYINDVAESTKLPIETVTRIFQALVLKGAFDAKPKTNPIGYDTKRY